MQDLHPDLWTWPRKWSRLGWTLQEWTSLMAHMKWVKDETYSANTVPSSCTTQSQMGISQQLIYQQLSKPKTPAVTSLIQVCAEFDPRRSSSAVVSLPSASDSEWICPLQLQPSVWHYSCGLVTSVAVMWSMSLYLPLQYQGLCRSLRFGEPIASQPTLWPTFYYWPFAFKSHASLPFSLSPEWMSLQIYLQL